MRSFVFLCALFGATVANAAPVQWTLNNVTFGTYSDAWQPDNTLVTGSFIYDADTNAYSNINLTTREYYYDTDSSSWLFLAHTFNHTETGPMGSSSSNLGYFGSAVASSPFGGLLRENENVMQLLFAEALSNAGGTVSLLPSSENSGYSGSYVAWSPDNNVAYPSGPSRFITGGTVVGISAVPIPAAAWLFGSALVGLGWLRRKQTALI